MTATPVSVCIRIRVSVYSVVTGMIPAEESAISGIDLILLLPDVPIRIIASRTNIFRKAKTNGHTLAYVMSWSFWLALCVSRFRLHFFFSSVTDPLARVISESNSIRDPS